jgi:hypothetical protein
LASKIYRSLNATKRSDVWAITCYFNPAGSRRRLLNYKSFRKHLNVPLVAVELAYESQGCLDEDDADVLIRLPGKDVLWQKERLLNLAFRSVPNSCRKVAWLDCDIIFEQADWAQRTSALLDRFALVQPFTHVYRSDPNWRPGNGLPSRSEVRRSIPFIISAGMPAATCLAASSRIIKSTPGYAWAARRELLEDHGLYDACIIGGGDVAISCAAYGAFHDAVRTQQMNEHQRQHYIAWAKEFYDASRADVTFADGTIVHLWHGNNEHRRYRERYEVLSRLQFNPFHDIALDERGVWQWNTEKTELHEEVRTYFKLRFEDGQRA